MIEVATLLDERRGDQRFLRMVHNVASYVIRAAYRHTGFMTGSGGASRDGDQA
jgi:hypothetical protein